MRTTENPFQSRFGYHPCDYATYCKLKALHRAYWQAVYDFHRWHRWWRKQPENRQGDEPKYCASFVVDKVWYKPVITHGVAGFKVYPRTLTDHGIVAWHQAARTPMSSPVTIFDESTLATIEKYYEQLKQNIPS